MKCQTFTCSRIRTMNRRVPLWLAFLAMLTGCASTPPPPVLPKMAPLRINISSDPAHFQVAIPVVPATGYGIVQGVLQDATTRANRVGTEGLHTQMAKEQQGEVLGRLFATELRRRFVSKGGVVESNVLRSNIPEVTLDHLSAVYMANTLASSYVPIAFVYLSASTDPMSIGNRPGGHVRSIEVKVPNPEFSFPTTDAMLARPSQANEGLRVAIVDLAEKVATLLVVAQRGQ